MPLLWYLRDELALTGTKYGCGMGLCGACTVHINGEAARSCLTPMKAAEAKNVTTIEDDAFIGTDSQLVAPVRIGRGAYVAAGSCITEDVPPEALAVARARQINKEGWVRRKLMRTEPK